MPATIPQHICVHGFGSVHACIHYCYISPPLTLPKHCITQKWARIMCAVMLVGYGAVEFHSHMSPTEHLDFFVSHIRLFSTIYTSCSVALCLLGCIQFLYIIISSPPPSLFPLLNCFLDSVSCLFLFFPTLTVSPHHFLCFSPCPGVLQPVGFALILSIPRPLLLVPRGVSGAKDFISDLAHPLTRSTLAPTLASILVAVFLYFDPHMLSYYIASFQASEMCFS